MQSPLFSLQAPLILRLKTLLLFVSLLLSSLIPSISNAHEVRPSIVDFVFNSDGYYQLSIQLNLEALLSEIGTEHDDTSESANSIKYDSLRKMAAQEIVEAFDKFTPGFLDRIQLKFDEKMQPLNILDLEIPDVGDTELARDTIINFAGLIPENTQTMSWQWDANFGNAVLRVASETNPELHSSYLLDGKASEKISIGPDCSDPKIAKKVGGCLSNTSGWQSFANYIVVGFNHIIPKGLDHILFVVGLFLLSTQLRPLLIQITSFTLAHSVTLALGIFGIVTVSPAIVEPLIAASIIYVCIENIFTDKLSRWRPILVFLFGLLHGLGFASVLTDFGLAKSNFISGLIGFNLGVEFGQLAVIAICFIAVGFWFSTKSWYRQMIVIPASVVIGIIATYWLVERIGIV